MNTNFWDLSHLSLLAGVVSPLLSAVGLIYAHLTLVSQDKERAGIINVALIIRFASRSILVVWLSLLSYVVLFHGDPLSLILSEAPERKLLLTSSPQRVQHAVPLPNPHPATSSFEDQTRMFINGFFEHAGDPTDEAIKYFTPLYASKVNYNGRVWKRADLMSDKKKYVFDKWPSRSYTIQKGTLNVNCDDGQLVCIASGAIDWDYGTRYGSSTFSDTISFQTGQPLIIKESGAIIERQDRQ